MYYIYNVCFNLVETFGLTNHHWVVMI
jgi:hypothetical protein